MNSPLSSATSPLKVPVDTSPPKNQSCGPDQKVISYFFDHEKEESNRYRKEAFVISAMDEYAKYAKVHFDRVQDRSSASIRIGFRQPGNQHCIAIGTDALMIKPEDVTMNLGGMDLTKTDEANFTIALHAIGHVLGRRHESPHLYEDSIMKYSSTISVEGVRKPQLSAYDKAWLTLNYPKALINKDGGPEDIWTLHRSLRVLGVNDDYLSKILKSDDLSKRRLLYYQFIVSELNSLRAAPIDEILDMMRVKRRDYMTAIPGSREDILLKLQDQVTSSRSRDTILDLLRILEISSRSSTPTQTSESNPYRYDFVDPVLCGEYAEESPKEPLTREELDDLLEYLPEMLNYDASDAFPSSVQHGLSSRNLENLTDLRLQSRTILAVWISTLIKFAGARGKSINIAQLSPSVTDTIVRMLQNDRPKDVFQEIHSLCFASTLVHDASGTETDLQGWLQKSLQRLLPEIGEPQENGQTNGWTLAWGPVAWKAKPDDDSGGPDLVWYVAHKSLKLENETTPRSTYVIAIAGTQMRSLHTWFSSNIDVATVIDFKTWASTLRSDSDLNLPIANVKSGKPYIARGTARTVWRILTVPAPDATPAPQTLFQFLESRRQSDSDLRLIITGHSLGGALTPTLALALTEAKVIPHSNILTYFIAGPSPGNDAFARLFANTFQAVPKNPEERERRKYKVWNLNLVNERDPVPQAWSSDELMHPRQNLSNVHKKFPAYLRHLVRGVVTTFLNVLFSKTVDYAPLQSQIFSAPSSLKGVLTQHSEAYHLYVGTTPPPSLREALR
ncbi:hypothetical protein J3R83DRAFT_2336 [Lanmaoa asiatica]|nr:hypothetical protein J3R83DRAFT_2336 [Lanmaoa asiatica]